MVRCLPARLARCSSRRITPASAARVLILTRSAASLWSGIYVMVSPSFVEGWIGVPGGTRTLDDAGLEPAALLLSYRDG